MISIFQSNILATDVLETSLTHGTDLIPLEYFDVNTKRVNSSPPGQNGPHLTYDIF